MANEETNLILSRLDALASGVETVTNELRALREKMESTEPKADELGEFLKVRDAAAYLKLSRATLYKMRHLHVRRGGSIRFRKSDLDKYFRSKVTGKG